MKMIHIGFFGNFSKAFFDLIGEYVIDFVCFKADKDNDEILHYCDLNNIEILYVENRDAIKEDIFSQGNKVDFFVVASFSIIFDEVILSFPRKAVINIHPGILPQYRGKHPLPQAILNREKYMGITAHVMQLEIDKGRILNRSMILIDYDASYTENEKRLLCTLEGFVKQSIENFMKGVALPCEGDDHYYKPLSREKIIQVMNAKHLKDIV